MCVGGKGNIKELLRCSSSGSLSHLLHSKQIHTELLILSTFPTDRSQSNVSP